MAAASAHPGTRAPRYRRRRPIPALALLLVLGSVAVFVWGKVFSAKVDPEAAIRCNPPTGSAGPSRTAPAAIGQPLTRTALDRTNPVPAAAVKIKVLNASTQKGLATIVAESLHELGFAQPAEPDNDAAYPGRDLNCHGQIRFGANGAGAARTLSIVVPCAELVRDDRQDDGVDLALGKGFTELKPSQLAKKALDQLHNWADQQPAQPSTAPVDPALISSARDVRC